MRDFVFRVPTEVIFGTNQMEKFAKSVSKYGKKALIVMGGGSVKRIGAFDDVVGAITALGMEYVEFSGVKPNPRLSDAKEGIALAKKENVDLILALGGGSTIDTAKLIAAGVVNDVDPWDIVSGAFRVKEALPVCVVLTLAATGTEMDTSSVLQNEETKEKYGWSSRAVLPKVTLENPAYTISVNAWHTASGTADIMSHTMEQYFSEEESTYLQDSIGEAILRTAIHYGPIAVKEPENIDARANLMWASTWALNGLLSTGKRQPWSVHDMGHQFSAEYDLTHGVSLAILTPHWMRHILSEKTAPRLARFAKNVFDISRDDVFEQANAGIDALAEFFASIGIPATLREVNIDDSRFEVMAERATSYRKGTIQGYVPLTKEDVLAIYRAAL